MSELINNAQKAKIHLAKAKVGMTDDEYRELLRSHGAVNGGGEASSRHLRCENFGPLMQDFCALGYYDQASVLMAQLGESAGKRRQMLELMATHLAAIGKPTWAYANGIARKRFKVPGVLSCTNRQLYSINGSLMAYRNKGARAKQASARNQRRIPAMNDNVVRFPGGAR